MIYKLSVSIVFSQYLILVKGKIVPPMKHRGWPASTYPTRMNSHWFVILHFMNGETRLGMRLAGTWWGSSASLKCPRSPCSLGKEPMGMFGSYAVTRALKQSIVELILAWYGSNPPCEVEIKFKTCDLRVWLHVGSSLAGLFLWCGSGGAPINS